MLYVFQCKRTLSLYDHYGAQFNLVVPIELGPQGARRPAIPNYVFAPDLGSLSRWDIRQVYGTRLMRTPLGTPARVSRSEIAVTEQIIADLAAMAVAAKTEFASGAVVVIHQHHWLEGRIGTFVKYKSKNRARIRILSTDMYIDVDRDCLELL